MTYPYKAQLEILGVERVRKGMRAFAEGNGTFSTCFLGAACGEFGARSDFNAAAVRRTFGQAADADWMSWSPTVRNIIDAFDDVAPGLCDELRQSCLLYLAENGSAVEPPVPEGSVV